MSLNDLSWHVPLPSASVRSATTPRTRPARRQVTTFKGGRFMAVAGAIDAGATLLSAIVAGVTFNGIVHHMLVVAPSSLAFGVLTAVAVLAYNVLTHGYKVAGFFTFAGHTRRLFRAWNVAFLTALALVFMAKQSAVFSRGSIMLFYAIGFAALVIFRAFVVSQVKASAASGQLAAARIVLVGPEDDLRLFTKTHQPWLSGIDVVGCFVLRGPGTLQDDLALARASARLLSPDDIYILGSLADGDTIETCVRAFELVPAAIHIGPQPLLDRFTAANIARIGDLYSLNVVPRPLDGLDVFLKRSFDLAIAVPVLVLAMPLLILVALAIKLDSPGPALFLQRRYGFNQKTFRIVKFRSMTVAEDGSGVRSATRGDPRVTRVGRFIRRFNIDELPQLLNVIRGEMSLVGPRPHALIHNQRYEQSIAAYARRHNVKPGITGWAQVNGLRGEVTSEITMRQRLEHDLHYIDHWALGLDLRILVMTLLSRKAFSNAY